MKSCKECGSHEIANGSFCREHYNEYMRKYNLARYHARRAEAIERLGGACVDCASISSLEFDHEDASTKSFEIGRLLNVSKARFEEELLKCVLRCGPCHVEKSMREDWNVVEHGGGSSGKKNCPCALCKARKAEYMKNYVRPMPQ